MIKTLKDLVYITTEKKSSSLVNVNNYVSTENILPNRGGIRFPAKSLPRISKIFSYQKNDILISNIRPYFKKIWFSDRDGVRSNDVLAFRTKNSKILLQKYLYLVLQNDKFFDYVTLTSKGTKMPRGDKNAILNFTFEIPSISIQKKLINYFFVIESKIKLNNLINDNLLELAKALFHEKFSYDDEVLLSNYFLPKRGKNLLKRNVVNGYIPVVAGGLTPSAFHNKSNTESPVITISSSGANAGYTQIWGQKVWSSDSSYIDKTVTNNIYFWYLLIKSHQKQIFDSQTGSAQPHVYPRDIGNILIPKINEVVAKKVDKAVTPVFQKIFQNKDENKKLENIKSVLLDRYFD